MNENARAGSGDQRGRGRRLAALPCVEEGLERQRARRAQGINLGLDLACGGLLPLFNLSHSVGQIHKNSVALYRTLEKETGPDVDFRQVTNIRLAHTRGRMDEYTHYAGVAETIGVKVKFLSQSEVKDRQVAGAGDGQA